MDDLVLHELKSVWLIYNKNSLLRTPGGRPLGSIDKEHAQRILEELVTWGPDPSDAVSLYALACSYMDFATPDSMDMLIGAVVSDFEDDPVYRDWVFTSSISGESGPAELASPYPGAFMQDIGLYAAWRMRSDEGYHAVDIGRLQTVFTNHLRQQAQTNFRHLSALIYAGAHFQAPLTMAAYLAGAIDSAETLSCLNLVNEDEDLNHLLEEEDSWDEDLSSAAFAKDLLVALKQFIAAPHDRELVIGAAG